MSTILFIILSCLVDLYEKFKCQNQKQVSYFVQAQNYVISGNTFTFEWDSSVIRCRTQSNVGFTNKRCWRSRKFGMGSIKLSPELVSGTWRLPNIGTYHRGKYLKLIQIQKYENIELRWNWNLTLFLHRSVTIFGNIWVTMISLSYAKFVNVFEMKLYQLMTRARVQIPAQTQQALKLVTE